MMTKIMTMMMVMLIAVTLMAMAKVMVIEATMAIIKNNDLIVIPVSSDDHNGDAIVVTMILKKL